jgi:hypothetical protein
MSMTQHEVTRFRPYPFTIGQRIRIDGGPRSGDWEVIGLSEHTVTLRCPISGREFKWDRFCYLVDDAGLSEWPQAERSESN